MSLCTRYFATDIYMYYLNHHLIKWELLIYYSYLSFLKTNSRLQIYFFCILHYCIYLIALATWEHFGFGLFYFRALGQHVCHYQFLFCFVCIFMCLFNKNQFVFKTEIKNILHLFTDMLNTVLTQILLSYKVIPG